MTGIVCGVCGQPIADDDFFTVPTFTMQPDPERPNVIRPVLDQPIRMDPETGAICWCPPPNEPATA